MKEEITQFPRAKSRVIYWIFFALLFSVLIYSFYMQHQKLHMALMQLNAKLEHQGSELAQQKQILQGLQIQEQAHDQLLEKIHRSLEMADFELVVSRNIPAAIHILQTAEYSIKKSHDSALLGLQETLSKDIVTLQAIPNLDIEGLVLRIEKISEEVEGLPVISTQVKSVETVVPALSLQLPVWKRFLEAVMQTLRDSIVIRHHAQQLEPLLPPAQQAYLVANIRSQLAQASWAALHSQSLLYEHAITQAIKWIEQYYRDDLGPVQDILQRLNALQKIDIKPAMPDIMDALKKLDELSE